MVHRSSDENKTESEYRKSGPVCEPPGGGIIYDMQIHLSSYKIDENGCALPPLPGYDTMMFGM